MCLNCGCMRAHDDMGKPQVNITYEDLKRAAMANAMSVDATLAMIAQTSDKDRGWSGFEGLITRGSRRRPPMLDLLRGPWSGRLR